MAAATLALAIDQGATFQQQFQYKVDANTTLDMTGYTIRMSIKAILATPTSLVDLSTVNGKITWITQAIGLFQLNISATETAAFTWTTGVYDLEVVSPGGIVTRILKGTVTVDPEVTTFSG